MQHVRTCFDLVGRDTVLSLLKRASVLKRARAERRLERTLAGRVVGMLFELPSTRTRPSFEAGAALLGAHTVVLHGRDTQLDAASAVGERVAGQGEALRDAARVLGGYVDVLVARMRDHAADEELARHADVPVINGMSEADHPCQALTDVFTVFERKERPFELKWAWIGEPSGTAHGLIALAALCGFELVVAVPEARGIDAAVLTRAKIAGARVSVVGDPREAVHGAHVVATAAWTAVDDERIRQLTPFQLNEALLAEASDDYTVLHPLPAHRGREITDDVLEGMHSVCFRQAQNRLPVQQALLERLLSDDPV